MKLLVVDECRDAAGHCTIRVADGTPNGDISVEPVATVPDPETAKKLVDLWNEHHKIRNIRIEGRRWFNTRTGNTYHSARIWVNGEEIPGVSYAYGADQQYADSAFAVLRKAGYCLGSDKMVGWAYCQDEGIKLDYSAVNVQRKKDL